MFEDIMEKLAQEDEYCVGNLIRFLGEHGLTMEQFIRTPNNPELIAKIAQLIRDETEKDETFIKYASCQQHWLIKQLERYKEYFPHLDDSYALDFCYKDNLRVMSEKWCAVPKPLKIADTYAEAILKILELMNVPFDVGESNWLNLEDAYKDSYLSEEECAKRGRIHFITSESYEHFSKLDKLPGDFWLFPGQLGIRWQGASIEQVERYKEPNEHIMGIYEFAALMLIHPIMIRGPRTLGVRLAAEIFGYSGSQKLYKVIKNSVHLKNSAVIRDSQKNSKHITMGVPTGWII